MYFLLSGLEALLTSKVEPESDPHDDGMVSWRYGVSVYFLLSGLSLCSHLRCRLKLIHMMMAWCLGGTVSVLLVVWLIALLTSKVQPEAEPPRDAAKVPWRYGVYV